MMHKIAFVLVVVGALNWGLYALGNWMTSNWNVVNLLVGRWPTVENIVYALVGLAALVLIFSHKKDCRACNPAGM